MFNDGLTKRFIMTLETIKIVDNLTLIREAAVDDGKQIYFNAKGDVRVIKKGAWNEFCQNLKGYKRYAGKPEILAEKIAGWITQENVGALRDLFYVHDLTDQAVIQTLRNLALRLAKNKNGDRADCIRKAFDRQIEILNWSIPHSEQPGSSLFVPVLPSPREEVVERSHSAPVTQGEYFDAAWPQRLREEYGLDERRIARIRRDLPRGVDRDSLDRQIGVLAQAQVVDRNKSEWRNNSMRAKWLYGIDETQWNQWNWDELYAIRSGHEFSQTVEGKAQRAGYRNHREDVKSRALQLCLSVGLAEEQASEVVGTIGNDPEFERLCWPLLIKQPFFCKFDLLLLFPSHFYSFS
jgi:hypothetical protein